MPKYWITQHYRIGLNRIEPIDAESERAALDLAMEEDDLNPNLYDEDSNAEWIDIDVNEVEE